MNRIRKTLVLISILLFPMFYVYLSPYIIVDGAANGIVNGSLILFVSLTIISLFFGRAWCGWICPGSGMAEICQLANDKQSPNGPFLLIKWGIWTIWIALMLYLVISAGGYSTIDLLFHNESGIPLEEPRDFIIYYAVVSILFILPIIFGRRAMCKYICWMAPFQIIGRNISKLLRIPSLRLKTESNSCTHCKLCNKVCPMGIDVEGKINKLEDNECILCGNCIDRCPNNVINYSIDPIEK